MPINTDYFPYLMNIPSSIFEPGRTHCPGCHATLQELVNECPFCSFTAMKCVSKFPYTPPPLTRFMDPQGRLSARDCKVASKKIDLLEKRLPQVRLFICITSLEKNTDVREFGFWLFNRAKPEIVMEPDARTHGILLMVDRSSRAASLTVGYGLDTFIDDVLLVRALKESERALKEGRYGEAFAKLAAKLLDVLRERQTLAQFALEKWKRLRGGGSEKKKTQSESGGLDSESVKLPEVVVARRESVPLPKAQSIPQPRNVEKEKDEHVSIY